jgi:hypothetical protein
MQCSDVFAEKEINRIVPVKRHFALLKIDYAARILTRDSIPGQVVRLATRKS